jgi:trehalose 6-phosphate phosphatase
MVPHLFDRWSEVKRMVEAAERVRVFLDFDGTLAPICARPEQVRLSDGTRRALERLARYRHVSVAIVSGRRRGDLIGQMRLPQVACWGLFGWERRDSCSLSRGSRVELSRARVRLRSALRRLSGVRVEDKGLAVSVHVRGVPPAIVRQARDVVRQTLADSGRHLHVLPGSKVWDVVPREVAGKGIVLRNAIRSARRPFLPVYVGNDATDEPAFDALAGGITVRVGTARSARTKARYRLADPDEVRRFIEQLEGELS